MFQQEHDLVNKAFRWLANRFIDNYIDNAMDYDTYVIFSKFYDTIKSAIDWDNLTISDVKKLGFITWAQDTDEHIIWMIPAWLYPVIPEGISIWDSNFNMYKFNRADFPFESKYGYLSFGIKFDNTGET